MAHKVTYQGFEINQPGLKKSQKVFFVAIPAKDLIDLTMFKVDFWKKEAINQKEQGYQRVINSSHAQKIASYLCNDDATLPNSILLSTREYVPSFQNGKLTMNKFPNYIVDGQHRIAGLRIAIEDNNIENWKNSTIPVIILSGFEKFEEMVQFVELNTKQKKIQTDLALQLMYDMSLDAKWKDKFTIEGNDWKIRAIKIVNELNNKTNSPWHDSIKIAGENKKGARFIASSNSFATSLKPLVKGVFEYNRDVSKNVEIISNYWEVLREILRDAFLEPKDYAIQKTAGLFSLHSLLQAILSKKEYKFGHEKNKLKELLKKILDEADADIEFWRSDNTTGITMYGSMKGFRLLSDKFIEALNKVD